jgi:hypothetical protein
MQNEILKIALWWCLFACMHVTSYNTSLDWGDSRFSNTIFWHLWWWALERFYAAKIVAFPIF